ARASTDSAIAHGAPPWTCSASAGSSHAASITGCEDSHNVCPAPASGWLVFQRQMTLVIRKHHVKLSAPLGILHVFGQPTHCRANHSRDESDGALERYRR